MCGVFIIFFFGKTNWIIKRAKILGCVLLLNFVFDNVAMLKGSLTFIEKLIMWRLGVETWQQISIVKPAPSALGCCHYFVTQNKRFSSIMFLCIVLNFLNINN